MCYHTDTSGASGSHVRQEGRGGREEAGGRRQGGGRREEGGGKGQGGGRREGDERGSSGSADPGTGRVFWVNHTLKETVWHPGVFLQMFFIKARHHLCPVRAARVPTADSIRSAAVSTSSVSSYLLRLAKKESPRRRMMWFAASCRSTYM